MRITGNRIIDLSAAGTQRGQQAVATRSEQISSGMRVTKPSDDPTAYATAERAKLRKVMAEGTANAVQASHDRLDETDGALATIGDIVSQIRMLAVQGANDSYNASHRLELGAQVRALFTSAVGAANQVGANGEYLLAGSQSLVAPFDPAGGYVGDTSERAIPSGETTLQLSTIPGSRLTAAHGVDVLPLLARVATALDTNDTASLQVHLGALETAIQQVGLARTITGGAMAMLEQTVAARDSLATHLASTVANTVELDTIEAASELAKASQSLEASRAVTSHLVTLLDPRNR